MKTFSFYYPLLFIFSLLPDVAPASGDDSLEQVILRTKREEKARKYNQVSQDLRYKSCFRKSIFYAKKALHIALTDDSLKLAGDSYNNMGLAYLELSDYDSSCICFDSCYFYRLAGKDSIGIATSLTNKSMALRHQGKYKEALVLLLESVKIWEKKNHLNGIASTYNNIGIIYEKQKNYGKALEYYRKVLKIDLESGNLSGASTSYNNIGIIYKLTEKYDSSLYYYKKSLEIERKSGNKNSLARALNNIGRIYSIKNDYTSALSYYEGAGKIWEESGSKFGVTATLINSAECYVNLGKYHEAEINYLKAHDLINETGEKELLKIVYQDIAVLYYKMKDFGKAYEYHCLYSDVKDTLLNIENSRQINQLREQFETEKKELRIVNLEQENQLKEQENQKQRMIMLAFIAGFVLILLISVLLYRLFVLKKRANILLNLKNTEITQKNEEITTQRDEIEAQRDEISRQHSLVLHQKEDIESSITYAKRIQQAILPGMDFMQMLLSDYFVVFIPKDIVSGDFYWVSIIREWQIFVVADCTGHGVPGAFMSMLGISFLNEITRKDDVTQANHVLNNLRNKIIESLKQKGGQAEGISLSLQPGSVQTHNVKDGMDIAICALNLETGMLQFAGANNSLYLVRNKVAFNQDDFININRHKVFEDNTSTENNNNILIEITGDKMPVAVYERMYDFTNIELPLCEGDTLYLMSDGYEDQFGGPQNRKFMSKNLRKLILQNSTLAMARQKEILEDTVIQWIGQGSQIDDITILGVKT